MQDWMILVLAIAVLTVALVVVARDKPKEREFLPDDDPWYGGTGSGGGEQPEPTTDPRD